MDSISHVSISIIYAFLGGILPSIVWLLFWMREDKKNPEPFGSLALAFMGGVAAVFISLFLEKLFFNIDPVTLFTGDFFHPILEWFRSIAVQKNIALNRFLLVIFFAPIIEEVSKFVMAYFFALRSKDNDEPLDPIIYMITTALGFAAMENMLFLIDPISKNDIISSILTGNMRFVGAMLLHTVSSATIGVFISFNFFKKKIREDLLIFVGILVAILIHSIFNYFMIGNPNYFIILEVIWIVVIMILLAFEKIKRIKLEKIQIIN